MGNQFKSCVDCGGGGRGSKSFAVTDSPGTKNRRPMQYLSQNLKTPELRAEGLINLNYSDLPQIILEKRNLRIQRIRELRDSVDYTLDEESLLGERSAAQLQLQNTDNVSVTNISFNQQFGRYENHKPTTPVNQLENLSLQLSRSAEFRQEGQELSDFGTQSRKLSLFAKKNETFGKINCSSSVENLLEPLNFHRLVSPTSSQKSEQLYQRQSNEDHQDINDRISDGGVGGLHQCDTCNVIKFEEDELIDTNILSPQICALKPSQSESICISTKLGNVLDLEIKSCLSISTIQANEELQSDNMSKFTLNKNNQESENKSGINTRVIIETQIQDICVQCQQCIKGISVKSLFMRPFNQCDTQSAGGFKNSGINKILEEGIVLSPTKSPCLLKKKLKTEHLFDDESYDCPLQLDLNQIQQHSHVGLSSSFPSSQNGSTSSFLTRGNTMTKRVDTQDQDVQLQSGSSSYGSGQLKSTSSSRIRQRKAQVLAKMTERRQKILINKEYKLSRKETINKVSIVLQRMIEQFHLMLNINHECTSKHEMNLSSLLFNEQIFLDMPKKTTNQSSFSFYFGVKKRQRGLATQSQPSALQVSLYSYDNDPEFPLIKSQSAPAQKTIELFINKIFQKMRLTNEVCLLAFIFIERIIVSSSVNLFIIQKKGDVRILSFNWKPIVYISIMIASKYWDDISFWNIDFCETLSSLYSLQACNQLESTFLAMCGYELYVSEDLYDEYYDAIIRHTTEQSIPDNSVKKNINSDKMETKVESQAQAMGLVLPPIIEEVQSS